MPAATESLPALEKRLAERLLATPPPLGMELYLACQSDATD